MKILKEQDYTINICIDIIEWAKEFYGMPDGSELANEPAVSSNGVLYAVPVRKLHQEHDEEIKRVMDETGTSFRKWNGKTFWKLANECGHTSLDFKLCACRKI